MTLPNEFYITLASDESSEYFDTKYKHPNFTNKLPSPLLFKEGYSVALTEVYIPPFKVEEITNPNELNREKRGGETNTLIIKLEDLNFRISVPITTLIPSGGAEWHLNELIPVFFQNTKSEIPHFFQNPITIRKMKYKLREIVNSLNVANLPYDEEPPKGFRLFRLLVPYDQDENKKFKYIPIFMPIKRYQTLHNFFSTMLEQVPLDHRSPRMLSIIYRDIATSPHFDIPFLKGISDVFYDVGHSPDYPDDIVIESNDDGENMLTSFSNRSEFRMLYIYSDIVSSHTYANRMLNLLRVIPYYDRNTERNGLHIKFDSPEFYPLSKEYFESISIIVSTREYEISFNTYNKNPIYLKLLFRRM